VVGITFFDIPVEEVFFFVIQTLNTSILYLILNKPAFHPAYLSSSKESGKLNSHRTCGQVVLCLAFLISTFLVNHNGVGTYLGLIVGWAAPFMLLLW
jgi:15-cis-phytoene synthase/lycopene beta-cyclase